MTISIQVLHLLWGFCLIKLCPLWNYKKELCFIRKCQGHLWSWPSSHDCVPIDILSTCPYWRQIGYFILDKTEKSSLLLRIFILVNSWLFAFQEWAFVHQEHLALINIATVQVDIALHRELGLGNSSGWRHFSGLHF